MMVFAILAVSSIARAGIQWSWVNAGTGTEQGAFITDGELVGGFAPPGSYTILDFSVTASDYGLVIGTLSGGDYICLTPENGFDWDGTECTEFWRSSGLWTNGFDFRVPDPAANAPDAVGFGVNFFVIHYDETITFLEEDQTVILIPEATVTDSDNRSLGAVKRLYR